MIPQGELHVPSERGRGRERGSNKSYHRSARLQPAQSYLQYRQSHDCVSESARREVHTYHTCTSSSGSKFSRQRLLKREIHTATNTRIILSPTPLSHAAQTPPYATLRMAHLLRDLQSSFPSRNHVRHVPPRYQRPRLRD